MEQLPYSTLFPGEVAPYILHLDYTDTLKNFRMDRSKKHEQIITIEYDYWVCLWKFVKVKNV